MWNQTEFKEKDYDADELDRFPKGAGYPGGKADWGWMQHILASLKPLAAPPWCSTPAPPRAGRGNANTNKEKDVRRWFVEQDLIEGVHLPAGKSLLQHHRAGHHHRAQQGQAEGAQGQAVPAQRQPRVRQGRSQELSSPTTPSSASPTLSPRGRK